MVIVIGVCDACGSVSVNDGVCDKMVPSLEWLRENGYEFAEDHNIMHFYCCDACVNHYRVDYCACGSGEDYRTCECHFIDKVPMYELDGPGVRKRGWLAALDVQREEVSWRG
jgi:hypothetical protein